jgi:adenine-specific DNA-methyltransferase
MPKKDYSQLSKEQLIELLEKSESKKKYGLVWDEERVPEKVVADCRENLPVLTEVREREIHSSDDEPTHIMIEGDNYHALSVLNYTHAGKIDLIYIDPPYNSGKKDWKYNNNYVDKNDTWRHSKWIQFMYNRLSIARNLLTDDGILVCAIDHNEQENLGVLLRELFGNKEVVCVTIIHNPGGIQGDNFSYNHEYAYFVFPKKKGAIATQNREHNPDIRPLRDVSTGSHLREDAANCFYPIFVKDNKVVGFGDVCADEFHPGSANVLRDDGIMEIYPIDAQENERKWTFARDTVESIKDELTVEFNNRRKIWDIIRVKTRFNYKTVWSDKKFNSNTYGTKLLNSIVNSKFPFPKSLYNVKECIEASVIKKKNALILDFFAGSGTTGHAVFLINKEDGGRRQFILCTNNENNIADDVTYPRISNLMKGYEGKGKEEVLLFERDINYENFKKSYEILKEIGEIRTGNKDGFDGFETEVEDGVIRLIGARKFKDRIEGFGNNLKYFRTSFVKSGANKDQLRIDLTRRCTAMLCLKEGAFKLKKQTTDWEIFAGKDKFLAIYYDFPGANLDDLRDEMNALAGEKVLYCFTVDPHGLNAEDFSDWENARLEPIPQKILDVYKQIFQ